MNPATVNLLLDASRVTRTTDIPAALPLTPATEPTPAERAWATLRHIEASPWKWDQDEWRSCFAGWTVRMSGRDVYTMTAKEIYSEFRSLTGLGWWRTLSIIQSINELPRLRRLVRRYFGPDPAGH